MGLGLAAAALWLAAAFRLVRLRQRPHSRSLRAMTIALAALAFGATMTIPPVARAIDAVSHVPDLSSAFKETGIVLTAAAVELMLSLVRWGPALTRRAVCARWVVAAAVAVVALAMAFLAGPGVNWGVEGTGPWIAESRLLVTAYSMIVLVRVVVLCVRNRTATALGRGVVVMGTGAAVVVIYCVVRGEYLLTARYFSTPPVWVYDVGTRLASVGLALIALGTVLAPMEQWVRARRGLARLDPLWRALDVRPVPMGHAPPRWVEAEIKLDYRIVQIQDALYLRALDTEVPPRGCTAGSVPERAAQIPAWLENHDNPISMETLSTPAGWTDRAWMLAVARAYRGIEGHSDGSGAPPKRAGSTRPRTA